MNTKWQIQQVKEHVLKFQNFPQEKIKISLYLHDKVLWAIHLFRVKLVTTTEHSLVENEKIPTLETVQLQPVLFVP